MEDPLPGVRRRPRRQPQPLARPGRRKRLRIGVFAAEQDEAGLFHDAVVDALEPVVEEPDHLVEPVEVRARVGVVRQRVDPVPDERPSRRRAAFLHPQDRIDVLVHPATDREDRRFDRAVVRRQRSLPPVRAVMLLAEPFEQPDRRLLQALAPLVGPRRAAVLGLRRHRVHPDHADRVLAQLRHGDAAADVVDVVGVAVVGGHHRHDRLEMRRTEHRDLDRGEAAVRDSPHPDVAVAPRLGGQPLDGVVAVLGFARRVLVEGDAWRRAGPADVEPAKGEAAGGQPLAAGHVAREPPVVLAVRDHLEDRRERLLRLVGQRPGQPQVRRELEPVARRDPDVVQHADLVARLACGAADFGIDRWGGHRRQG